MEYGIAVASNVGAWKTVKRAEEACGSARSECASA